MKKIIGLFLGAICWAQMMSVYAIEKFEILPDLPEPLASAQASSVSKLSSDSAVTNVTQSVGQEPNILSVVFSLLFVILLIYASLIAVAKLNKLNNKTLRNQFGDKDCSRVSVISTTALGSNKTLHVVELDGKRMLIGASNNSIDLIKDLGNYPPLDAEQGEFSNIEIPNIRIPKIEIPKIEFPNIGFTHAFKKNKINNGTTEDNKDNKDNSDNNKNEDGFVISEIYEESSDGIIDKLFAPQQQDKNEHSNNKTEEPSEKITEHSVDPDEYALYKKYL